MSLRISLTGFKTHRTDIWVDFTIVTPYAPSQVALEINAVIFSLDLSIDGLEGTRISHPPQHSPC